VNKSLPPVALAITGALVVTISVGSEISKYGLDTARFFGLILGTPAAAFAGACIGALISWIVEKIRDKSPSWDAGEQVESNIMTSIVWGVILLVLIIIGVVAYREDAAQKTAALQASEANTISVTSDTSKLKYMPKERKYETLGLRKEPDVRSKRIARLERSDKVRIGKVPRYPPEVLLQVVHRPEDAGVRVIGQHTHRHSPGDQRETVSLRLREHKTLRRVKARRAQQSRRERESRRMRTSIVTILIHETRLPEGGPFFKARAVFLARKKTRRKTRGTTRNRRRPCRKRNCAII